MFSLVIPVYNEDDLIDELVKRTVNAIESFIPYYEIILVDDGSTDRSLELMLEWQTRNNRIRILSLSRNFGHQAALTAGLEHASGDIVAMMDGDLQDPPEVLSQMFYMIRNEGYDIVSGKKSGRKGNRRRNLYAFIFHFIVRKIGEIKDMENYGNFSM